MLLLFEIINRFIDILVSFDFGSAVMFIREMLVLSKIVLPYIIGVYSSLVFSAGIIISRNISIAPLITVKPFW